MSLDLRKPKGYRKAPVQSPPSWSANPAVYSAEDVCVMIDCFPNVLPEVAQVMKDAIHRGECPHAVRVSLGLKPVTMYVSMSLDLRKPKGYRKAPVDETLFKNDG
jgi:hypothetical protein